MSAPRNCSMCTVFVYLLYVIGTHSGPIALLSSFLLLSALTFVLFSTVNFNNACFYFLLSLISMVLVLGTLSASLIAVLVSLNFVLSVAFSYALDLAVSSGQSVLILVGIVSKISFILVATTCQLSSILPWILVIVSVIGMLNSGTIKLLNSISVVLMPLLMTQTLFGTNSVTVLLVFYLLITALVMSNELFPAVTSWIVLSIVVGLPIAPFNVAKFALLSTSAVSELSLIAGSYLVTLAIFVSPVVSDHGFRSSSRTNLLPLWL